MQIVDGGHGLIGQRHDQVVGLDAGLVGGVSRYTIDSYRSLARGDLGQILWVTFVFVALSIVFQMLLGFLIALLIDESGRRGLIGVGVTRTLVMTAWAIPGVVIGIIWKLMYQESDSGILNYLFSLVGFSGNTPFLSNPHIALLSVTFANGQHYDAGKFDFCQYNLLNLSFK